MTDRWQLSDDGGASWDDIHPANTADVKYTIERDLDSGQIFFRWKLGSDLVFGGRDRKAEFEYFRLRRMGLSLRCEEYQVRHQELCGAQWKTLWTGYFARAAGSFDLDRCTYSVRPKTLDRYSCLLDRMDKKINALNAEVISLDVLSIPAGMEVLCVPTWPSLPFPQPADFGWDLVDTQTIATPSGMGICSGASASYQVYWRETVITDCINGSPVPPAGTGWVQLSGTEPNVSDPITCDDEGKTKWARQPTLTWPWPNDAVYVGPGTPAGNDVLPPGSPSCSFWYRVGEISCVGGFVAGLYLCVDEAVAQLTINRARLLQQVFANALERIGCEDVTSVASDLLEWNAPGDAVGYSPGINYVTAEVNELDQLVIIQNSDAIDPTATNPATIGETTLGELLALLRTTAQVYWDIDDQGRLRLEHWSYWTSQGVLDLAAYPNAERRLFAYLADETPRRERLVWAHAQGRDFVGADLVYPEACVGPAKDEAEEHLAGPFTSDIAYVISDPDAINKQGFVFIAARRTMSAYATIVGLGSLSGLLTTNSPLSTANLQDAYWRQNRLLPYASMNEQDEAFEVWMPTADQKDVMAKVCCDIHGFDPRGTVHTRLREALAADPMVQSAEYVPKSGALTMVLRYAV